MGLGAIPNFFRPRKVKVGIRQSYGATQLGKQKDEKASLDGPYAKVLNYVVEEGPSSISEIERGTGLSNEKVKMVLNGLLGNGYISHVSQEG